MVRYIGILVISLILVLASGCGDYATPVSGQDDTAAQAGISQPTAADTGAATSPAAGTPQPSASPQPAVSPTASAQDSAPPDNTATVAPPASPSPAESPAPTASAPSAMASPGAVQAEPVVGTADVENYLPLRSSTSNTSEILVKIPKDGSFTVMKVAPNTSWLKVSYSGKMGYVLVKYVKISGSAANRVCTVLNDSLNVRSGAGKKYGVLGILDSGATVVVTAQAQASSVTWYEIAIGSETGYVDADYCRISAS